jgi:hypothetical protein
VNANDDKESIVAYEKDMMRDGNKLDEFVDGEDWNDALESNIDGAFLSTNSISYDNNKDDEDIITKNQIDYDNQETAELESSEEETAEEEVPEEIFDDEVVEEEQDENDGSSNRRRKLTWKIKIRRVFHHHSRGSDADAKAKPIDPVQALLESGGKVVEVFVFLFAGSAVTTTIIGSYLSLASAFQSISYDFGYGCGVFMRRSRKAFRKKSLALFSKIITSNPFNPGSDHHSLPTKNECEYYGQFFIVFAAVGPSVIVACHGPELFYGVVKFSGGFIVPLLYLLVPALMVRATRKGHCLSGLYDLESYKNLVIAEDERKQQQQDNLHAHSEEKNSPPFWLDAAIWKERDRSEPLTWGGDFSLFLLCFCSVGLVLANTYQYLVS